MERINCSKHIPFTLIRYSPDATQPTVACPVLGVPQDTLEIADDFVTIRGGFQIFQQGMTFRSVDSDPSRLINRQNKNSGEEDAVISPGSYTLQIWEQAKEGTDHYYLEIRPELRGSVADIKEAVANIPPDTFFAIKATMTQIAPSVSINPESLVFRAGNNTLLTIDSTGIHEIITGGGSLETYGSWADHPILHRASFQIAPYSLEWVDVEVDLLSAEPSLVSMLSGWQPAGRQRFSRLELRLGMDLQGADFPSITNLTLSLLSGGGISNQSVRKIANPYLRLNFV